MAIIKPVQIHNRPTLISYFISFMVRMGCLHTEQTAVTQERLLLLETLSSSRTSPRNLTRSLPELNYR